MSTQHLQLQPGTIFARDFRVQQPLDAGGMGAIYVVEQVSTGVARALKVMHPEMVQDARSRERFAQEARISSRIESDHVVQVVAAGVDDATGLPWIAMELLRGETLAAAVERRGALPVGQVVEVFRQLGHALGHAHAVGLVHRDLKPENIFLATPRRDGVAFTLKLLDFGIAKLVQESRLNLTGANMLGSPFWMAPEQGGGGTIVPATDIYALGLLAFYVLTGRYYWRLANMPSVGAGVLVEVLTGVTDAASVRAAAVGSHVRPPPAFDAWFARCTVRASEQRYRDATEAVGALIQILGGLAAPTLASTPGLRAYTPPTPARGFAAPPYAPGQAAPAPPGYATPASFAAQPPSQPGAPPVHRTQVANLAELPFAAPPPSYPGHNGFAAQQPSQGGFAAQPGSHPGHPVAPQNAGGTGAFRTQMTPWPPHGQPPGPVLPPHVYTPQAVPPPRRRSAGAAIALISVAVVGVAVGAVLIVRHNASDSGGGTGGGMSTPPTDPGAPPVQTQESVGLPPNPGAPYGTLPQPQPTYVPPQPAYVPPQPPPGGYAAPQPYATAPVGTYPQPGPEPVAVPPAAPLPAPVATTQVPVAPPPVAPPVEHTVRASPRAVSASSGLGGAIYDHHSTNALAVVRQPCVVGSMDISVRGHHTFFSDMIVRLRSPSGTLAVLQSHASRSPFRRYSGSQFAGTQAAGSWVLSVTDDVGQDAGMLQGFSLSITCR